MSGSSKYTVSGFMRDAQKVLETTLPLAEKQAEIADRMALLSQRDDLTRFGMPIGPADGSTQNYLLAFEPPFTLLGLSQFDPHYLSPVHEHGDFWVIACGWRGVDRWDMYERKDDGSVPGYADLDLVDQVYLSRGKTIWMPPPPRSIHSHNNETGGLNCELIFTAAEPMKVEDRLFYNVEEKTSWPSLFPPSSIFPDTRWPAIPERQPGPAARCEHEASTIAETAGRPDAVKRMMDAARAGVDVLRGRSVCPSCNMIDALARLAPLRT